MDKAAGAGAGKLARPVIRCCVERSGIETGWTGAALIRQPSKPEGLACPQGPTRVQRDSVNVKRKAVAPSQLPDVETQAGADALESHPFMLFISLSCSVVT